MNMFNASNAPQNKDRPTAKMDLATQAELDMLVDDELPEQRRSALLRRMDQFSDGWRNVALCFLEHQAQRRAFRDLVSGAVSRPSAGKNAKDINASRFFFAPDTLRIAAAVLVTASIFSLAGLYAGRQGGSAPAGRPFIANDNNRMPAVATVDGRTNKSPSQGHIRMLTSSLPPELTLPNYAGSPFVADQGVPTTYPAGSGVPGQNRIMVVGDGPNQVMAFPLTPVGKNGHPVY